MLLCYFFENVSVGDRMTTRFSEPAILFVSRIVVAMSLLMPLLYGGHSASLDAIVAVVVVGAVEGIALPHVLRG